MNCNQGTQFTSEELAEVCFDPRGAWGEAAEFNRDDYRAWAKRLMERAGVAEK